MSVRENIQVFHLLNIEGYLAVLHQEFGARLHPEQSGCYLIDNPEVPFYEPELIDDHVSILGFNYSPLSSLLIQALINHEELAPNNTLIRWSQEQDLILEDTLGSLRSSYHQNGE